MTMPARWSRLGLALPVVLLLFAATDVALRLIPARVFAFRTWEIATQHPAPGAPFQANGHFATPRAHGDLSNQLGLVGARSVADLARTEALTSDQFGFRNLPALTALGPITIVAIGSSFTVGASVGDHETFPAQLATLTRRSVYNAGGIGPTAALVDSVVRRNRMAGGTVVYEVYESINPPTRAEFNQPVPCSQATARRARALCLASQRLRQLWRFSPLSALLLRVGYTVRPLARRYTLPGGITTVLRPDMLVTAATPPSTRPAVTNLLAIAEDLRARQLRLIVVLVPAKETVYGPLLTPPSMPAAEADDYLTRLERDLRAAGLEVVNTTSVLRAGAAAPGRTAPVYIADDSHWSACGIALAAREVAAAVLGDADSSKGPAPSVCTNPGGATAATTPPSAPHPR